MCENQETCSHLLSVARSVPLSVCLSVVDANDLVARSGGGGGGGGGRSGGGEISAAETIAGY